MLRKLTVVCGELDKIDERVSQLIESELQAREDITLVMHPAAKHRASEQITILEKILYEAICDNAETHLIVATNSASIISRIGELVEMNYLDKQTAVVELAIETVHRVCLFDAQGVLTDWPIGYL